MKYRVGVGFPDVITHANLGDDRFRLFEGAWIKFPTFPLTYIVVLNTVPACDIASDESQLLDNEGECKR